MLAPKVSEPERAHLFMVNCRILAHHKGARIGPGLVHGNRTRFGCDVHGNVPVRVWIRHAHWR